MSADRNEKHQMVAQGESEATMREKKQPPVRVVLRSPSAVAAATAAAAAVAAGQARSRAIEAGAVVGSTRKEEREADDEGQEKGEGGGRKLIRKEQRQGKETVELSRSSVQQQQTQQQAQSMVPQRQQHLNPAVSPSALRHTVSPSAAGSHRPHHDRQRQDPQRSSSAASERSSVAGEQAVQDGQQVTLRPSQHEEGDRDGGDASDFVGAEGEEDDNHEMDMSDSDAEGEARINPFPPPMSVDTTTVTADTATATTTNTGITSSTPSSAAAMPLVGVASRARRRIVSSDETAAVATDDGAQREEWPAEIDLDRGGEKGDDGRLGVEEDMQRVKEQQDQPQQTQQQRGVDTRTKATVGTGFGGKGSEGKGGRPGLRSENSKMRSATGDHVRHASASMESVAKSVVGAGLEDEDEDEDESMAMESDGDVGDDDDEDEQEEEEEEEEQEEEDDEEEDDENVDEPSSSYESLSEYDDEPPSRGRRPNSGAARKRHEQRRRNHGALRASATLAAAPNTTTTTTTATTNSRLIKRRRKKADSARTWSVPYDQVTIPMGGDKVLETILGARQAGDAESPETEYLIKFKHTSHLGSEWVSTKTLEKTQPLAQQRIKRFLDKTKAQAWGEGEYFNPAYAKVDRVIDEGELGDPTGKTEAKLFYLVKWHGLGYEACTWEAKETLDKVAPEKVQAFMKRRILPKTKQKVVGPIARPPMSRWEKYSESPAYKNDNKLRDYQLEGLNWLTYCYLSNRCSIIADEMGLGKTVQIVCFLNELYHTYGITGPFMIIAPLSTLSHWIATFENWTDLNAVVFHGSAAARNLIVDREYYYRDIRGSVIPHFYKFDVIITTYEQTFMNPDKFRKIAWRAVVLDEGHRLKNKSTKLFEALSTYHMEHRVIITGTPLQNSLEELFTLLNFLEPEQFASVDLFLRQFGNLKSSSEVEKLQKLLQPIMLRRLKEDVEKSIPVKEETVVEVELTNVQKKLYRALLEKNLSHLTKGAEGKTGITLMLNVLMMLRQICIHPYLIKGGEEFCLQENKADSPEQQYTCMIEASGKMVLIDKLLRKLRKGGHKVLIFSQMTGCLDIIGDYLQGQHWKFSRIDGRVRGNDRQAAIDRFCNPESDVFVFLLCTRAGGVGLNLTVSDTAIIFDSDWNPQNDLQAQARVHRIGQTKPVKVYRLLTRNTYETEMFDRASKKLGLDKAVLQRFEGINGKAVPNEIDLEKGTPRMSRKEIEQLLKRGAYGALLDDTESSNFCEEDIDQILSRRTHVIRHSGSHASEQREKGLFSKASFQTNTDTGTQVDVNDPDFWNKFATKAGLKVEDPKAVLETGTRSTRSNAFSSPMANTTSAVHDHMEGMDDEEVSQNPPNASNNRLPRLWKFTEKLKFERKLIIYGLHQFEHIASLFPRRTVRDAKAICRAILETCTVRCPEVIDDPSLLAEVHEIIVELAQELGYDPERPEVPYSGASKKAIEEYKSFLINAPEDYISHLTKKGKFMCARILLLRQIRSVFPSLEERRSVDVPILSRPPADWWGVEEDRDLLVGTLIHGYQQYEEMQKNPNLVFAGRVYLNGNEKEPDDEIKENNTITTPAMVSTSKPMLEGDVDLHTAEIDQTPSDSQLQQPRDDPSTEEDDTNETREIVKWPGKADLGQRIRRLVTAILRQSKSDERAASKEKKAEEKLRLKHERAQKWTKKEKAEFVKVLLLYGVETASNPKTEGRDWSMFKRLSNLQQKTDDTLEEYFQNLMQLCHLVNERDLLQQFHEGTLPADPDFMPNRDETSIHEEIIARQTASEEMTVEKAKRVLRRVEFMESLRTKVLHHPDYCILIKKARRTAGLPDWWVIGEYDDALLRSVARYGFSRYDLVIEDLEFPFRKMREEGHILPRESFLNRRVETVSANILNPKGLLNKKDRALLEARHAAAAMAHYDCERGVYSNGGTPEFGTPNSSMTPLHPLPETDSRGRKAVASSTMCFDAISADMSPSSHQDTPTPALKKEDAHEIPRKGPYIDGDVSRDLSLPRRSSRRNSPQNSRQQQPHYYPPHHKHSDRTHSSREYSGHPSRHLNYYQTNQQGHTSRGQLALRHHSNRPQSLPNGTSTQYSQLRPPSPRQQQAPESSTSREAAFSGLKIHLSIGSRKRRQVEIDYDTSDTDIEDGSDEGTLCIVNKAIRVLKTVKKQQQRGRQHAGRSGLASNSTGSSTGTGTNHHMSSSGQNPHSSVTNTPRSSKRTYGQLISSSPEDESSTPSFLASSDGSEEDDGSGDVIMTSDEDTSSGRQNVPQHHPSVLDQSHPAPHPNQHPPPGLLAEDSGSRRKKRRR